MFNFKNILITGGAGFIGGTLVRRLLQSTTNNIFNIDYLNYASDLSIINQYNSEKRHHHIGIDLNNFHNTHKEMQSIDPDIVINLAAESHVDRSIDKPIEFVKNNINATLNLLEASKIHYSNLTEDRKKKFVFLHVSTDEVFGSLGNKGFFNENSCYYPRSPYSASKASTDHLVNAWSHTYNLPIIITNCSNNYGPYQYPEKLIPLCILKALNKESIPIYGDGMNIRDWLFVDDHVEALLKISKFGKKGNSYCIGGNNEKTNIEVVKKICGFLDELKPTSDSYLSLIKFVKDRPGHDKRYAINSEKLQKELNWSPKFSFDEGLELTVRWYLENIEWCKYMLQKSEYKGERLGLDYI